MPKKIFYEDGNFAVEKVDYESICQEIDLFIRQYLSGDDREILHSISTERNGSRSAYETFDEFLKSVPSGNFDEVEILFYDSNQPLRLNEDIYFEILPKEKSLYLSVSLYNQGNCRFAFSNIVKRLRLYEIYDVRLLLVKNKSERDYLEEALICFNNGALRASVIMGWNAVMYYIYKKIERRKNGRLKFIKAIKKKRKKIYKINKLEDYQNYKDSDVLEELANLNLFDSGTRVQLKQYLDLRNRCAHVKIWKPPQPLVEAFFDDIFNNIFKI